MNPFPKETIWLLNPRPNKFISAPGEILLLSPELDNVKNQYIYISKIDLKSPWLRKELTYNLRILVEPLRRKSIGPLQVQLPNNIGKKSISFTL